MGEEGAVLKQAAHLFARIIVGHSQAEIMSEYVELPKNWRDIAAAMLTTEGDKMSTLDAWLTASIDDPTDREALVDMVMDAHQDVEREGWEADRKVEFWTFKDAMEEIDDIKWMWPRWIPRGHVTMLGGRPECGKSALVLALAGIFGRGDAWPDGTPSPNQNGKPNEIVWLDMEHNHPQTKERIEKWGVPPERLIWMKSADNPDDKTPFMRLDDDVNWLKLVELCADRRPGLVIIDTLRSALGNADENSSMIATFLGNCAALARAYDMAIIIIHHVRKRSKEEPVDKELELDDFRGSGAIIGTPRSVIGVDRPNPETGAIRIRLLKANWTDKRLVEPLGFEFKNDMLVFEDAPHAPLKQKALERCAAALMTKLHEGMTDASEIKLWLKVEMGFSERSIRAAKIQLGIESRKSGKGWAWSLPSKTEDSLGESEANERERRDIYG